MMSARTSVSHGRGAAAIGGAVLVSVALLGCSPEQSDPAPGASATPTQTSSSAAPSSTAAPVDTATWTTFGSDRYGFSIGHPADWTVLPAEHDWDLTDANELPNPGHESFLSPTGDVGVSAWSVPAEPGTTIEETPAGVKAWVEQYCEQTENHPCTDLADRAVQLCNEERDCHPGLLVPFDEDVQAFFTGGDYQGVMIIVAVWRAQSHPTVEPYGGSQQLLEAFLSTMDVFVRP